MHKHINVYICSNTIQNHSETFTFHAGAGIYVKGSSFHNNFGIYNNSVIVKKSSSCYYCRVVFYCYSNSSSSNVGYVQFPTGSLRYNDSDYYHWEITRTNPSGMRVRSYQDNIPYSWGVFTCRLPDSNGKIIETSIGVYPRMPGIFMYCFKIGYSCLVLLLPCRPTTDIQDVLY